jgi:hypothetical protein
VLYQRNACYSKALQHIALVCDLLSTCLSSDSKHGSVAVIRTSGVKNPSYSGRLENSSVDYWACFYILHSSWER